MSWESVNASEGYEHGIIALKEELEGDMMNEDVYDILTLSAKNITKHTITH